MLGWGLVGVRFEGKGVWHCDVVFNQLSKGEIRRAAESCGYYSRGREKRKRERETRQTGLSSVLILIKIANLERKGALGQKSEDNERIWLEEDME
jgi:hypothetical protein